MYCFERQTDSFRKNRHTLLTEAQIDMAVTFAVEHGVKEITLFGGEPLNRTNLSQVDYICKKTKDTGIKLRAITNGHDLDTFIPYLGDGPGMISYLQITLDGPADIHDRRRITLDGESSFQHITTNVKAVLTETQVSIGIRVNVDARNVDRIEDLIEQLKAAEILNQERCAMYLAPVIGLSKTRESDFDILRKITALESKYDILYQGSPDFDLAKKIMEALSSCNPLPRNTRSCGANRFATVFSPDGCIYPCLEVVGYPEEASATFDSEGRIHWRKDITDKWLKTRLQYREKCIACKYALLCDGGCAKHYLDGISTNNNCYQFEERLEDILTNVGNIYFETLNS